MDRDGLAIWYKRLEWGCFILPKRYPEDGYIERRDLTMFVKGVVPKEVSKISYKYLAQLEVFAIRMDMILTLPRASALIAQKDAHIGKLTRKLESTQRPLTILQMEQMLRRMYGHKSEQLNPNQLMFNSMVLDSLNQNYVLADKMILLENL